MFHRRAVRKGISSILAAVIITVLITISFNAFFAFSHYSDLYADVREERNTREWEKQRENLNLVVLSIDGQKLNATVTNEGQVPITLVDLWITERTVGFLNTHKAYSLNIILPPASYETNIGQNQTSSLDGSHTYDVEIYTSRGNSVEQFYLPPSPQTSIGPFYFSFDKQSFNYTYYYSSSDNGGGIAWDTTATTSQSHPKNNLMFILKFTNHGTRPIEISYLSYMLVVVPASDYLESEYYFHLLNDTSTSQSPVAYKDYSQIVPANLDNPDVGVTQTVKFGATAPGASTLQVLPPHEASSTYDSERTFLYTVWIGIFWRWSGTSDYYGIYVPFTGMHVGS